MDRRNGAGKPTERDFHSACIHRNFTAYALICQVASREKSMTLFLIFNPVLKKARKNL